MMILSKRHNRESEPKVTVEWSALLLRIREVPGSDINSTNSEGRMGLHM
jgi:hypothetical protein